MTQCTPAVPGRQPTQAGGHTMWKAAICGLQVCGRSNEWLGGQSPSHKSSIPSRSLRQTVYLFCGDQAVKLGPERTFPGWRSQQGICPQQQRPGGVGREKGVQGPPPEEQKHRRELGARGRTGGGAHAQSELGPAARSGGVRPLPSRHSQSQQLSTIPSNLTNISAQTSKYGKHEGLQDWFIVHAELWEQEQEQREVGQATGMATGRTRAARPESQSSGPGAL